MKTDYYSIDGKFGRVEYPVLEEQKGHNTTYNKETYDRDTMKLLKGEEFISGLPEGISNDDYFKMALLDSLHNIVKYEDVLELSNNMKDIRDELCMINVNLQQLVQVLKKEK